MNDLMRNRWVVGLLAVVAVILMAYQFWPRSSAVARGSRSAAKSSASAASKPASSSGSADKKRAEADRGVARSQAADAGTSIRPADRQYLADHFDLWRDSPARDPFGGPPAPRKPAPTRDYPPASERLTIQALWLQTGQKLAVINNQVLSEGDRILDYTIQSIGPDHIWVTGPLGREQVEFKLTKPAAASSKQGATRSDRSTGSRSRR